MSTRTSTPAPTNNDLKTSVFDMPVHPAADIFPMLGEDELEELAEDIRANGLLHPLVAKDGVLIDGRNRREGCRRAGVTPTTVELDSQDPNAYILSANIARRHLSKGQQAMAVAKLFPEGEKGGRGKKNSSLKKDFSGTRLSYARTVLRWTPQAADAVLAGSKSLNEAYEEAQRLKRADDTLPQKMERLKKGAPDFYDLVKEDRMTLNEATAAMIERQAEEERHRRAFFDLFARMPNIVDWTVTEPGRRQGLEYIRRFPKECPVEDPKEFFRKLAEGARIMSEAL